MAADFHLSATGESEHTDQPIF